MLSIQLLPNLLKETDMYLYGASGHCKVIIEIIRSTGNMPVDAVHDDNPAVESILGIPVKKIEFNGSHEVIISIGSNSIRKRIVENIHAVFLTAIDKSAIVSPSCSIGQGTVVMPGAIINADVSIGKHCIINTGAVIDHDCNVYDFVHISPNVALAGNVSVGEGSQIGIGASIIQNITIGKWVTVGAGAAVIRDVPDYAVVVGNPAKIIKYNPK